MTRRAVAPGTFTHVVRGALLLAILAGIVFAVPARAGVVATPVGPSGSFANPTYVTAPPRDVHRLFVVQQGGQIELIKDGGAPTTFLDIHSKVTSGGEQGLLSIAFPPNYATSHAFFVYYTSMLGPTCPNGCDEHVSEFTANSGGDTANASSERLLITIPHPQQTNHNGGQLQFGPDGDLYISVGDGGGSDDVEGNAQHTDRLLGKLLRISPNPTSYTIPAGNPFAGHPECSTGPHSGTPCPEVWAYGLRNPWRFSFDSATGDLAIGDVGQDRDEEIDYAHRGQNVGANYGWPCYEGFEVNASGNSSECATLPSPVVFPVLAYQHPDICAIGSYCGNAVIGGYVMHDPALPSLNGCYVYGDLSNQKLRVTHLSQPFASTPTDLGPQIPSLSSFGEDASGHLYAVSVGAGTVYRLGPDGNRATDPTCPRPPGSTPGGPGQPTPRPAISSLRLAPSLFLAARRGAAVRPVPRKRKFGSVVSFRSTRAAVIRFTVDRLMPGRRKGNGTSRCVAISTANRSHKRCTRIVRVRGQFSVTAPAGRTRFLFTGRVGSKTLKPGRYRLHATPHAGTQTGNTATAGFRVKARPTG